MLAGLVAFVTYRRFRDRLSRAYVGLLIGLRLAALVLLAILLLRPFLDRDRPDASSFVVYYLADSSGSMKVTDTRRLGENRLSVVSSLLDPAGTGAPRFIRQATYEGELARFSEEVVPSTNFDETTLPGRTAIGGALERGMNFQPGPQRRLGGVVMLSDGRQNTGPSAIAMAKQFAQAGLPVTTIGVGEDRLVGDLRAKFEDAKGTTPKGEEVELRLEVTNDFQEEAGATVTIFEGNQVIERQEVTIPAEQSATVTARVKPQIAGNRIYRAVIESSTLDDQNATTDVDYFALEVTDPFVFNILFLGSAPSLEHRFLSRVCEAEEQLALSSLIRTSSGTFQKRGFDAIENPILAGDPNPPVRTEQDGESLADELETKAREDLEVEITTEQFAQFEVIILDPTGGLFVDEEVQERLEQFVSRQGGGLLVLGDPSPLPGNLQNILPMARWETDRVANETLLKLEAEPVFEKSKGGLLFTGAPLFVAEEDLLTTASELKPIARRVMETQRDEQAVLAVQAYGSGRVAFLGTAGTWNWRMQLGDGLGRHASFWRDLLSWLGSNTKPRVESEINGQRVTVGEVAPINLSVRSADFRPAGDARISSTVTGPDGNVQVVELRPSSSRAGDYQAEFIPNEAGEYEVSSRIVFDNGEELLETGNFIASVGGGEMAEPSYNEELLRDIARITGGEFRHYTDARNLSEIPLTSGLDTTTERLLLTSNWLFLICLVGCLGGEWFMRRRVGLR